MGNLIKNIKLNLLLVGIGYWGKVHLKYIEKINTISIKKILFKKNKKNLKYFKNYNLTKSLKEALNDQSIKYVDIVTPIETHEHLCLAFLKKNKKILVEKPLVYKNKEIPKSIKNGNLQVSYPYLFSKTLNFLKKKKNKFNLGKLHFIDIKFLQCGRFMKYDVLHLLAPHIISIISIFFDLKKIKIEKKKIIVNKNITETAIIKFFYLKKIICQSLISINYSNEKEKKIILYFQNGIAECDLENKKNNLIITKYKRKKFSHYKIAEKKITLIKTFDERNNIMNVITNFIFNNNKKFRILNLIITKKINEFLKK